MDDPIKAAEIANASGDKAACYHLARQYENIDNIPEAIHFFSKAQAYSNAIRICKEQGKNKPIIGLVLTRVGFGILRNHEAQKLHPKFRISGQFMGLLLTQNITG